MREGFRERKPWKELETGLGTIGRLRIMAVLSHGEPLTKYILGKRTGLKAVDVRNNLRKMVEIGWVREFGFHPRKYEVNHENEIVKKLLDFLNVVNHV